VETPLLVLSVIGLLAVLVFDFAAYRKYRRVSQKLEDALLKLARHKVRHDWRLLAEGDDPLEQAYLKAAQRAYRLFVQKNHDYGHHNLSMGWTKGVALRLGDKVSRLWRLLGLIPGAEGAQVKDESIADTCLDGANYFLVGYLMEKDVWPKVSVDDIMGPQGQFKLLVELIENNPKLIPRKKNE
jgi:hypothetical protein